MTSRKFVYTLAIVFTGLVCLANYLASLAPAHVLTLPGGYSAPWGVLCVGVVLVLKDWAMQIRGIAWSLALVLVAGLISLGSGFVFGYGSLVRVALASLCAFAVSEGLVETLILAPFRRRNFTLGVGLSATVGNAVDSLVFLVLAFPAFWTTLYVGNFLGKMIMILAGVLVTYARRRRFPVPA